MEQDGTTLNALVVVTLLNAFSIMGLGRSTRKYVEDRMDKGLIELALRRARHELKVCGNEDHKLQHQLRDALRELYKDNN